MSFFRIRASHSISTDLGNVYHPPKHIDQNHRFHFHSNVPCNNYHLSNDKLQNHFCVLINSCLWMCYHQAKSLSQHHNKDFLTTSLHIHCCLLVCVFHSHASNLVHKCPHRYLTIRFSSLWICHIHGLFLGTTRPRKLIHLQISSFLSRVWIHQSTHLHMYFLIYSCALFFLF